MPTLLTLNLTVINDSSSLVNGNILILSFPVFCQDFPQVSRFCPVSGICLHPAGHYQKSLSGVCLSGRSKAQQGIPDFFYRCQCNSDDKK